ncbi:MAG: hypothetical protein K6B17_08690 [Treponema sp.]|nr:hypothetical protein [Treponema sp.]
MKNIKYIIAIFILLISNFAFADEKICLFCDAKGNRIYVKLNEDGVINSIEGNLGDLSLNPITVCKEKNGFHIDSEWSLFQDCFDVYINRDNNKLEVSVKNNKNKEFYRSEVSLNKDNLPTDEFKTISKTTGGYETVTNEKSYSLLPNVKNINGVVYQFFGNSENLAQKFEYKENNVNLYRIMPGDEWQKYLSVEVGNIKSNDIFINLINYMIIYCANSTLGSMMFPVLIELQS